ncbi:MAG: Rdx family protein [Candidatus Binatia bacterium]
MLTEYKQRIHQLTLAPYDDGRFEVFLDGKQIYSKLATGDFPEYAQIHSALEKQAA